MKTVGSILCILLSMALDGCGRMAATSAVHGTPRAGSALPGFRTAGAFREQQLTFRCGPDVRIHINAPSVERFDPKKPVELVFYALPNSNTIEQTAGKTVAGGDDFRFHIQNIAAQTRWLRERNTRTNLVVAYLETDMKSWPSWNRNSPDRQERIRAIADSVTHIFGSYKTRVVLSGHSGGGSFIFGLIDSAPEILDYIERIAFLDSDYGYTYERGEKITRWLVSSRRHHLSVLAYNDSIALYQGKPFVSPTGGTWYRTKMMCRCLAGRFRMHKRTEGNLTRYRALGGRISVELMDNPERAILHTVQVEKNGFIHTMLTGTGLEEKGYAYYGDRVYDALQSEMMPDLVETAIPTRPDGACTGSAFMERVASMTFEEREREILAELSRGNLPDMLRKTVRIATTLKDSAGATHSVVYEVMPDYLAIGSDGDCCRIPMGPLTAQALSDRFRMTMPTRKLVDDIHTHAAIKLEPVTYWPVGNANELVPKFVMHDAAIDSQLNAAGAHPGDLVAGIKKDVVISNRIAEPNRPGHVCIYGWHRLDGRAIQPLTNIHINTYTDYSHGVRLMNADIMIDGVPMRIADALKDPALYSIVSDEVGMMAKARY